MKTILSIFAILSFTATAVAADAVPQDLQNAQPPTRPTATVWVEGEDFVSQAGGAAVEDRECYGGRYWGVYRKDIPDASVTYGISIPRSAKYRLYLAGQPVGTGYTSPVRLWVDEKVVDLSGNPPVGVGAWSSAKAIRWSPWAVLNLAKGSHLLKLEVLGRRAMDEQVAFRVDALALKEEGAMARGAWKTAAPGNVFTAKEAMVIQPPGENDGDPWLCVVTNFEGREVFRKEIPGNTPLNLPPWPEGYFEAAFVPMDGPAQVLALGRVPDPEKRARDGASPFGVDAALSWLSRPGKHPLFPSNSMETTIELLRRTGLTAVRDRMSWNQVNPSNGVYLWTNVYSSNLENMRRAGIQVLSVHHDAPAYSKGDLVSIPRDLFAVYRFHKEMAARWGHQVMGFEFWNEPDISFCKDPAWDFAAAAKAAYLGYKAGAPAVPVLLASAAQNLPLPRFYDVLFQNGVASHFDVFNFHIYRELKDYPALIAEVQDCLGRYGASQKPMWVTENGLGHEGGGLRPPLLPGTPQAEHDGAQDRQQAEHLVKALVTATALGVARDFFFVFPPYNERENQKVWGLFRWDFSVKPGAMALSTLNMMLGSATLLGSMDVGPGIEAYLYDLKGEHRIVAWTTQREGLPLVIPGVKGMVQTWNLVGDPRVVTAGDLKAGRFPVYLTGLSGLKPDRRPVVVAGGIEAACDTAVVLRFGPLKNLTAVQKVSAKLDGERAEGAVEAFNFSSTPKRLEWKDLSTGGRLEGMPKASVIPAMSSVTLPITFQPTAEASALSVGGTSGGLPVSPIFIPIRVALPSRKDLVAKDLPWHDGNRWRKNSSGAMAMAFDDQEKAMRFDVTFPDKVDRWIYPEFPLDLPRESLAKAGGLSFEIRVARPSKKEFHNILMAVLERVAEKGTATHFEYPAPGEAWQQVLIDFGNAPGGFEREKVQVLRIGSNPPDMKWTYWIRNVKVYLPK